VVMHEGAFGPALDTPKPQLQKFALDDTDAETLATRLSELLLVEEVAVLIREIHHHRLLTGPTAMTIREDLSTATHEVPATRHSV